MKLGKKRAFFTLGLVPIFGYIGSKFGPQNSRKTTAPLPCRSISSLIMLMLSNMCNTMAGQIATLQSLLSNYSLVKTFWYSTWLAGQLQISHKCWSIGMSEMQHAGIIYGWPWIVFIEPYQLLSLINVRLIRIMV